MSIPLLVKIGVLILAAILVVYIISLTKKASDEEAKSKGIKEAGKYLNNPVIIDEYLEKYDVDRGDIDSKVNNGEIKAYSWRGHLYLEDQVNE